MHEHVKQPGFQQDREDKTEHGTVEVGVVIDVIPAPFRHVLAIKQVDKTKNDTGNGNYREEINFIPRVQEYCREQNSRNRPGSPDRRVVNIIPVFPQIVN